MRDFILYIDEPEWGIYEKGYKLWAGEDYDKKLADRYPFAALCVKEGLIMGFFDISSISDEVVKTAQNDEMMREVCNFRVLIHNKFKESFKGSLVDALQYVKEHRDE
ncbi:hypothetical protein [uncultured Campylobacter sp.]|uniref:hypothetical protein n=1 Tax=uncultured Campylobacter sp. TaxID=218934 RepID=UPI002619731B|nr:hypothetical protein [uncultured Campylobacter sp.]